MSVSFEKPKSTASKKEPSTIASHSVVRVVAPSSSSRKMPINTTSHSRNPSATSGSTATYSSDDVNSSLEPSSFLWDNLDHPRALLFLERLFFFNTSGMFDLDEMWVVQEGSSSLLFFDYVSKKSPTVDGHFLTNWKDACNYYDRLNGDWKRKVKDISLMAWSTVVNNKTLDGKMLDDDFRVDFAKKEKPDKAKNQEALVLFLKSFYKFADSRNDFSYKAELMCKFGLKHYKHPPVVNTTAKTITIPVSGSSNDEDEDEKVINSENQQTSYLWNNIKQPEMPSILDKLLHFDKALLADSFIKHMHLNLLDKKFMQLWTKIVNTASPKDLNSFAIVTGLAWSDSLKEHKMDYSELTSHKFYEIARGNESLLRNLFVDYFRKLQNNIKLDVSDDIHIRLCKYVLNAYAPMLQVPKNAVPPQAEAPLKLNSEKLQEMQVPVMPSTPSPEPIMTDANSPVTKTKFPIAEETKPMPSVPSEEKKVSAKVQAKKPAVSNVEKRAQKSTPQKGSKMKYMKPVPECEEIVDDKAGPVVLEAIAPTKQLKKEAAATEKTEAQNQAVKELEMTPLQFSVKIPDDKFIAKLEDRYLVFDTDEDLVIIDTKDYFDPVPFDEPKPIIQSQRDSGSSAKSYSNISTKSAGEKSTLPSAKETTRSVSGDVEEKGLELVVLEREQVAVSLPNEVEIDSVRVDPKQLESKVNTPMVIAIVAASVGAGAFFLTIVRFAFLKPSEVQ